MGLNEDTHTSSGARAAAEPIIVASSPYYGDVIIQIDSVGWDLTDVI